MYSRIFSIDMFERYLTFLSKKQKNKKKDLILFLKTDVNFTIFSNSFNQEHNKVIK